MKKYELLNTELGTITERKQKIEEEYRTKWNLYHNRENALQRLVILGDSEEVKALQDEVDTLRVEAYRLKSQFDAFGDPGKAGVRAMVAEAPTSKPHKLALEVMQEGIDEIGNLQPKLEKMVNVDLPRAKNAYLTLVKEIGDSFRVFYDCYAKTKIAQECLLKDEWKLEPLRFIAPNASEFEIDQAEIHKAYGNRPIKAI